MLDETPPFRLPAMAVLVRVRQYTFPSRWTTKAVDVARVFKINFPRHQRVCSVAAAAVGREATVMGRRAEARRNPGCRESGRISSRRQTLIGRQREKFHPKSHRYVGS